MVFDKETKFKISKGVVWLGCILGIAGAFFISRVFLLLGFGLLVLGLIFYLHYRPGPYSKGF